MESLQILPVRVRLDLEVIADKEYARLSRYQNWSLTIGCSLMTNPILSFFEERGLISLQEIYQHGKKSRVMADAQFVIGSGAEF